MKGKTLAEFIDALYYNAEMEIEYNGNYYLISCFLDNRVYSIRMYLIAPKSEIVFSVSNIDRTSCVTAFESAKLFDGRTIYEAHNDITVIYG